MTDITTDGQLVIAVKEGLKAMETQKWTTQQGKGTIQKWKDTKMGISANGQPMLVSSPNNGQPSIAQHLGHAETYQ